MAPQTADVAMEAVRPSHRHTMDLHAAIERNPRKCSGAWVFRDTRVPVITLFDHLAGGATVEEFHDWFPGVAPDAVDVVLAPENRAIIAALLEPTQKRREASGSATLDPPNPEFAL